MTKTKTKAKPRRNGKPPKAKSKDGRLGPGQLDKLVLAYMGEHKGEAPHTASAIGKGIERSSGAVANCLVRLAKDRKVRQARKRPRRYVLKEVK